MVCTECYESTYTVHNLHEHRAALILYTVYMNTGQHLYCTQFTWTQGSTYTVHNLHEHRAALTLHINYMNIVQLQSARNCFQFNFCQFFDMRCHMSSTDTHLFSFVVSFVCVINTETTILSYQCIVCVFCMPCVK